MSVHTKEKPPRLGIGFDDPGRQDLFCDATPCNGVPIGEAMVPGTGDRQVVEFLETARGSVHPNPGAGSIHRREACGQWRQEATNRIAEENDKAELELQEKRVFGLAKQTSAGLSHSLGVRYEMTSIANYLRLAFRFKRGEVAGLDQQPTKLAECEHASLVLDAALQYDLRRVAKLLSTRVPQERTFGTSKRIRAAAKK